MIRDLIAMQDRINRLFDEVSLPRLKSTSDRDLMLGAWAPAVDIYEDDQAIVLKADLPEIDPKNVDIRVEDNTLYLKGERKWEKELKEENFHRIERAYGSFARSFSLPHTVSPEKITADFKNGVLRVTMPKREESKPKQIRVNVAS